MDLGYRGKAHHPEEVEVILPNRKHLTPIKKKMKKRRSVIEPIIGHLKSDHLMSRNRLSGRQGDEFNPILSGKAFNLKKILNSIKKNSRAFLFDFLYTLKIGFKTTDYI